MQKQFAILVLLLFAFNLNCSAAEKKMHACTLLNSSEIHSALGGTVGQPQESDIVIPEGPSKGETMGTCMWPVDDQSMVTVNIIPAVKGPERSKAIAQLDQVFEDLKGQGWTEEKKEITNGRCSILTPPKGQDDLPLSTGCIAEAKGMGISVGWLSGKKKVGIEKIKPLLDKVIGRLR